MSVLPVGIAASGDEAGYTLDNSLRFRSSVGGYLSRTPSTAGNRKTYTLSAWFKRGALTVNHAIFSASDGTQNNEFLVWLSSTNSLSIQQTSGGTSSGQISCVTSSLFRDPSAWYHMVLSIDTTQATSTDRLVLYINGVAQTFSSYTVGSSINTWVNNTNHHAIGKRSDASLYLDGYLTEINLIDGQALTADDFGEFDGTTGVWKPKEYSGTYGTNGFYLENGRGTDQSGNGNNWTENNFNTSTPSASGYDVMTDVPTLTDENTANYATLNPLQDTATLSNGNLKLTGISTYCGRKATIAIPSTGKWYWETDVTAQYTAAGYWFIVGMCTNSLSLSAYSQTNADSVAYGDRNDGRAITNGTSIVTQSSAIDFSTGDVLQCAYDADTGKFWFGKNNAWWDSSVGTTGDPASGTNQTLTAADKEWFPYVQVNRTSNVASINFGQQPFAYTPPTGFLPLNTYNLPDSTIVEGSQHFNTVLYSGNSSTQSITGVGFQPDLVWAKDRTNVVNHTWTDAVRGAPLDLFSSSTSQESNDTNGLTSFAADGFNLGSSTNHNVTGHNYVAWNWKANGSGSSSTTGTIPATVSANTTSGFSVVTYTGTGSNGTVQHGLGTTPDMVIVKGRSISYGPSVGDWIVWHNALSATERLYLNYNVVKATGQTTTWNSTLPSSTVVSLGNNIHVNYDSSSTYVMYSFAGVEGFSAFGSFIGNGSTDGPFIYTGFRPAFVLWKASSAAGNWAIRDIKRSPYNAVYDLLLPNTADAESTYSNGYAYDFLSNGFKIRHTASNVSGTTYIYAAFAENPFKNSLAR
jgi:hypothetical protein